MMDGGGKSQPNNDMSLMASCTLRGREARRKMQG